MPGERAGSATAGQRRMNTPETQSGGSLKPVGSVRLLCLNCGWTGTDAEIEEQFDGAEICPACNARVNPVGGPAIIEDDIPPNVKLTGREQPSVPSSMKPN